MKSLLGGKFVPLTFSVGFLEAPLGNVIDAILPWTMGNHHKMDSRPIEGDLAAALRELEPLAMPPHKELLWRTDSNWTAYFDNSINGPDPFSTVSYMAQQIHCRGVIATYVPNTLNTDTGNAKGRYGAVIFQLFAPEQREFLNYERSVHVVNDGGRWEFATNGSVQPFEETESYSRRRIRDRFTPDMLEQYCAALGVRLWDDRFYCGPGLLINLHQTSNREMSLSQARKEMGLE